MLQDCCIYQNLLSRIPDSLSNPMTALYSLAPQSSPSPRLPRRRSRPQRRPAHRLITAEITVKLVVNTILSLAALSALLKLLPYQLTQQAKLKEVRMEVQETEMRVDSLRSNFSRNADPNQARKVMQEQSPRIDPNQRRIFWQ